MAINDDGEFERCCEDIYPPELELKKEHGNTNVSFLDLNIVIKGRIFETSLYDKIETVPLFYCTNAVKV